MQRDDRPKSAGFYSQQGLKRIVSTEKERDECIKVIQSRALKGNRRYVFSYKLYRRARTLNQNRFYWAVLMAIQQQTGNDRMYMHQYFKTIFLGTFEWELFGKKYEIIPSTTTLNVKQFEEYLNHVLDFCDEHDIDVARPDSQYYDHFITQYGEER